MEENVKLTRIKKSCRAGEIVTRILFILAIVGFVCAVVCGGIILHMGGRFDAMLAETDPDGKWIVTAGNGIARASLFSFDLGDPSDLHSDIPAIQRAIDDHPQCLMFSGYLFAVALITAILAVLMKLLGSVFTLIRREETPFTDKVIKRVVVVMAVASGLLLLPQGLGFGALGGILTWVVYTILDYGKTLQLQSDETL